jgi:hypothetical protein
MSERVSSFFPIEIGDFRYLYLLVTWNDFITPKREEVAKQVDPFGEALSLQARSYRPTCRCLVMCSTRFQASHGLAAI